MSAVATLSAVPTPASLTPESSPSVVAFSLAQARREFKALEEWLLSEESGQLPLHEVEREQERRGREIQRRLLEAHVIQRGAGDVGPAVAVCSPEAPNQEVLYTQRRLDSRHLQTIFGEIPKRSAQQITLEAAQDLRPFISSALLRPRSRRGRFW